MELFSTNHRAPAVSFREAVRRGLAPDGGLYLPSHVPVLDQAEIQRLRGMPFPDLAVELAARWLEGEYERPVLDTLVREALDIPLPIVPVAPGLSVLELFHGPTLAFKDFGARFLARFFGHELRARGDHATVLVATSGDTGSAVARGFHGVPGVRVIVLYPAGRVSAFQESQMATIGGNISAVRVPGSFDDCQRLVKGAFLDPALAALHLSSANSISIGRLLPQSFYYAYACLAGGSPGTPGTVFSVPSGNLGNLTAGVLAARMGLPIRHFIAATNVNDVFPAFLGDGVFTPRPAVATLSNAMDVGDPSNFARLWSLHDGQWAAMRAHIDGQAVTEADTREEIRQTYTAAGYVLDPHGAVACRAARRWQHARSEDAPVIALATAHPAKFGGTIASELGFEPELPVHERGWRERALLAVDLPGTSAACFGSFLLDMSTGAV
jgi:threonine synthase